jgi:hypothetical protein
MKHPHKPAGTVRVVGQWHDQHIGNYADIYRLALAKGTIELPPGSKGRLDVFHGDTCSMNSGGTCDCDPAMDFHDGDQVISIEPDGSGISSKKS